MKCHNFFCDDYDEGKENNCPHYPDSVKDCECRRAWNRFWKYEMDLNRNLNMTWTGCSPIREKLKQIKKELNP